ncbi:DnaJ domain-containing protein [Candidatus Roizmanbacteria bacterium]|nr:DnaJ domain-containing protein [Candidatus Roizmanbacteria bacterium]
MRDFYETLGISKNASDSEIKAAYRKQALKWHPDRNKSAEAEARFKEINKAYEVLSDSKKREMYNQYGPTAFERGGMPGAGGKTHTYREGPFTYTYSTWGGGESPFEGFDFGGFSDPFEIFEQFFGFQSPFSRDRGQQRYAYHIVLDFEEAIHGIEKEIKIDGKTKKVKIPAGVDSGSRIRFKDFDLHVEVKPHPYFRRDGQDIYYEKEISYPEATLGGVIEVPTLEGNVRLKVRRGTRSGTIVRLQNQGIPYPGSLRKGDQYVVFKIQVPERISQKAKRLLEDLQKEL